MLFIFYFLFILITSPLYSFYVHNNSIEMYDSGSAAELIQILRKRHGQYPTMLTLSSSQNKSVIAKVCAWARETEDGKAAMAQLSELRICKGDLTAVPLIPQRALLTALILDDQHLKHLDASCSSYPHLTTIVLKNCGIESIVPNAFKGLDQLVLLKLENNALTTLSWLSAIPSLKHLALNGNNITTIERADMQKIPQLTTLSLDNNQLSAVPPISALLHLASLSLKHNQISSVTAPELCGPEHLESLTLSHNNIQTFTPDTFAQLSDLSLLDLDGNPIDWRHTDLPENLIKRARQMHPDWKVYRCIWLGGVPDAYLQKRLFEKERVRSILVGKIPEDTIEETLIRLEQVMLHAIDDETELHEIIDLYLTQQDSRCTDCATNAILCYCSGYKKPYFLFTSHGFAQLEHMPTDLHDRLPTPDQIVIAFPLKSLAASFPKDLFYRLALQGDHDCYSTAYTCSFDCESPIEEITVNKKEARLFTDYSAEHTLRARLTDDELESCKMSGSEMYSLPALRKLIDPSCF